MVAYPVPATGNSLTFGFVISTASPVRLRVLDALGNLMADVTQTLPSGAGSITLDISAFASGVYYYQLTSDTGTTPLATLVIVH